MSAVQPAPVAAQPVYILDKDAILALVSRYGDACARVADAGSYREQMKFIDESNDLFNAIRAALIPVPAADPTIGEALCADGIHEADGSCCEPVPVAAQPPQISDPAHQCMYAAVYSDAQKALDELLGPNEEDGCGGGLVADIWHLARRCEHFEQATTPEPRWGAGPLVEHNPETPDTAEPHGGTR